MNSNTTDDLEEQLRAACRAAIPRLLENTGETHGPDADSAPLQLLVSHGADGRRPGSNRTRVIGGVAAGLLLVAAAAAIAGRDQPVTDQRPSSDSVGSPGPVQDSVAFDNDGTVPCRDFGCGQFDAIEVVPGVDDFYVGPASLGDPHISQSMWDSLIRCSELDASGACARIEGIGIVALVNYGTGQADQVQVGTTFGAHVTLEEYALNLGSGLQTTRPATTSTVVRGHTALLFEDNGQYPAVMWEERPGVLVWVAVPPTRQSELASIAETVVLQRGPSTIPGRVLVPNTGEPWRAQDNTGSGLVIAQFSGKDCVGWGGINKCSDRIEDRTFAAHFPSAVYIAGSVPIDVGRVRVQPEIGDPVEVTPFAYGGSSSRFYQVTLPPETVASVDWLGADGNVIATYQPAGESVVGGLATDHSSAATTTMVPLATTTSTPNVATPRLADVGGPDRFAPLPEGLAHLGFTLHTLITDPTTGVSTALDIRDETGGRTGALTVTPGTPLVPENHNRSPLRILEQTDVRLSAEVDSNDGWRFEITFTRTSTGKNLPTIAEIQNLLYSIDP